MEAIKRNIEIELKAKPSEVADLFCSMDGEEQAEFFNHIGESVKSWNSHFVFQLQSMVDTEKLTVSGRQIMFEIGEYSNAVSWKKQKAIDQFISDIPNS